MKYIRTKDAIVEIGNKEAYEAFISSDGNKVKKILHHVTNNGKYMTIDFDIINQANTIPELCDCYSYDTETTKDYLVARSWKLHNKEREIFGCVKTDKGLIYVAKMNNKGELELL